MSSDPKVEWVKMWRLTVLCTHDDGSVRIDAFEVPEDRLSQERPASELLAQANGHDEESFYGVRSTRPNPDQPVGGERTPAGWSKWRGHCEDCGIDVTLRWANVDRLVSGSFAAGVSSVELRLLAGI